MANDNNICRECGNPVLVQIQKNTGFCCVAHEKAFNEKKLSKPAKRAASKKRAAKAVRTVVE